MHLPNIRQILSRGLNPALCLTCGIPVATDEFLCRDCLAALQQVSNPCQRCGLPNQASGALCPSCNLHPPRWQQMTAPLVYTASARKLIQDFKFNEKIFLANALISHLQAKFECAGIDCLIPVPLHKSRLLERGFNQSAEIARMLSIRHGIPLDLNSLQRVRATQPQSGLSLHKRKKNILRAFRYRPPQPYRSVAIVDDVITSGSTMAEVCKTLQRGGVESIHVWALARALKQP